MFAASKNKPYTIRLLEDLKKLIEDAKQISNTRKLENATFEPKNVNILQDLFSFSGVSVELHRIANCHFESCKL